MIQLFALGLISILGQVVLLRELSVAFYGVELIYVLALGAWLTWTAAGTFIGTCKPEPSQSQVRFLFLVLAVLFPVAVVFIRGIRPLFSTVPGAYLPFSSQLLSLAVSLLPAGLLSGWLFPWTARRYASGGGSLAHAYGLECAGGLLGGVCATLFLRLGISNFLLVLICSAAAWAVGATRRGTILQRVAVALPGVALVIAILLAPSLDRRMTSWTHPYLECTADSPYGRVTVSGAGGQIAVFENDALSFTTEGTEAEEFTHLAALQHPRPNRVLILGGGIEGTVREILKHSPQSVDYVELNAVLLRLVRPILPAESRAALESARVRILAADPRQFVANSGKYDLILVGMPEPASGQANRFYTIEFFAECRKRLNPGGVLAFRLKSAENLWSPALLRRTGSIHRAMTAVFKDVLVLPGGTNIVIGSVGGLVREPAELERRFEARAITAELVSPAYIRYILSNDRFAEIGQMLKTSPSASNSDSDPVCYRFTMTIWLTKFFPALSRAGADDFMTNPTHYRAQAWGAALVLGLAFSCAGLLRRKVGILAFIGAAGLMGMVLETVLLLHYQVKCGVLYQNIGVLLMSFMAGLTLGAFSHQQWVRRRPPDERAQAMHGAFILAGFGLLCAFTVMEVRLGRTLETAFLLAAAGSLVGAAFSCSAEGGRQDQRRLAASLYAADLLGGSLGSILSSLFLVPFFGLVESALILIPILMAAVPLVFALGRAAVRD